MKIYLTYGGAMAIANALVMFALFFAGLHDTSAKLDTAQWIQICTSVIIGVACIVLGTKARRATVPATESFGYGSALGTGVLITLFAALIGIFTGLLYTSVVNPHFSEVIVQAQADKLAEKGIPADKIEQIQKVTATMMKPPVMAVMGFVSSLFFGTLISLVTAAFLKRPAVEDFGESPPPLR